MIVKWHELTNEETRLLGEVTATFRAMGWVVERVPSCSHNGPKTIGAYLLLHLKSGMAYVGSHGNLYTRVYQHHHLLQYKKHWIKCFQQAYENDSRFVPFLLPTDGDREAAYTVEQTILDKFHSSGLLFNTSSNARIPIQGLIVSEQTRLKLGDLARGRKQDAAWVQKRIASQIGVPLSVERKEKIRQAALNRGPVSPQLTIAAAEANSIKIYVAGVIYKSLASAANAYGIGSNAARKRILSRHFPDWMYADVFCSRKVSIDGINYDSIIAYVQVHEVHPDIVKQRIEGDNHHFREWKYV